MIAATPLFRRVRTESFCERTVFGSLPGAGTDLVVSGPDCHFPHQPSGDTGFKLLLLGGTNSGGSSRQKWLTPSAVSVDQGMAWWNRQVAQVSIMGCS